MPSWTSDGSCVGSAAPVSIPRIKSVFILGKAITPRISSGVPTVVVVVVVVVPIVASVAIIVVVVWLLIRKSMFELGRLMDFDGE